MNAIARAAFAAMLLSATACAADDFAASLPGQTVHPAWWAVSVGSGFASEGITGDVMGHAAVLGSISLQDGANIVTARYTHFSNFNDDGDLAVLYERALSRRKLLVSAGFGLGFRHERDMTLPYDKSGGDSDNGGVALAWSLQAVTRTHAAAGLGTIIYGSVNSDRSLVGMGLVMHLGKLETGPRAGDRR